MRKDGMRDESMKAKLVCAVSWLLPQLLRLSHTEKPLKIHTERDSE
jgi:hypothetical protein